MPRHLSRPTASAVVDRAWRWRNEAPNGLRAQVAAVEAVRLRNDLSEALACKPRALTGRSFALDSCIPSDPIAGALSGAERSASRDSARARSGRCTDPRDRAVIGFA